MAAAYGVGPATWLTPLGDGHARPVNRSSAAPGGEVLDDMCGVGADTGENRGRLGVRPAEATSVEPRVLRDAPTMPRITPLVEQRQIHPAKVELVAGGPHDGANTGGAEVEFGGRGRREVVIGRPVIGRSID